MVLAFLSLGALLFSHLALTDIYHGEADPSQEWLVLQVSAGILAAFILTTVFALARVLRSGK
jgi:hypothetical protein